MTWGSFLVKTLVMIIILFAVLFFAYGNYVLAESVVPVEGVEVDEWLNSYYTAGGVGGFIALLTSAIWFYFGDNYAGESGIGVKYYALLVVAIILSVADMFIVLKPAVEGAGMAGVFVIILAPIVYYLASIFAYAAPVKYIPAGAEIFHK